MGQPQSQANANQQQQRQHQPHGARNTGNVVRVALGSGQVASTNNLL